MDSNRRDLFRRNVLRAGGVFLGTAAGCLGSDSPETDSDGDGVLDSADYAPQDPEVSRKSDLVTETPHGGRASASRETSTSTRTPTATATQTPQSTPTPQPDNELRVVDESPFIGVSYITAYGPEEVRVHIDPSDPNLTRTDNRELLVLAIEYPLGRLITEASKRIDVTGSKPVEQSVVMDLPLTAEGVTLAYFAMLAPPGTNSDRLDPEDVESFHQTNPFVYQTGPQRLEPARVPELQRLTTEQGDKHERIDAEGAYFLTVSGFTLGTSWDVSMYIYKASYVDAVRRDHGLRRSAFVTYEMVSGFAATFAQILAEAAAEYGFESKREKVEFAIDFVQQLPYVPDDVSTGYNDYTKFSAETLCELGGDCEDTAIMLASVLQSEPFSYDMVLIQPPSHMACGILGADNLPGGYWEYEGQNYYYIETTGIGWDIGDVPEEYRRTRAYVIPV